MAKGLSRSISRGPAARAPIIKQRLALSALAIAVAGATGVGFGSAVVADLPEGNILLLGAVATLQFTGPASGALATFDGDFGIGSTPASDATLTGADVDVIASTAIGAATASVSPVVRATNATQVILDNTAGDLELNLNLLIDDASISADGTFLVSGFVELAYIVLGDD